MLTTRFLSWYAKNHRSTRNVKTTDIYLIPLYFPDFEQLTSYVSERFFFAIKSDRTQSQHGDKNGIKFQ